MTRLHLSLATRPPASRPLAAALLAAALLATPAVAQQQQGDGTPAPQGPPSNIAMARLMSDGAQVRGGVGERIVLQLGKFVFLCRPEAGKPTTCDLVP